MSRLVLCLFTGLILASPVSAIPPALPPSGPINGTFECMFEDAGGPYAAAFSFQEDAPLTEIMPMLGEREAFQGYFQQFPFNTDDVGAVDFEANGQIVIYTSKRGVVGRFSPVDGTLRGDGQWMRFSTPGSEGELESHGYCFGKMAGRTDRPVSLTRLLFTWIDWTPA